MIKHLMVFLLNKNICIYLLFNDDLKKFSEIKPTKLSKKKEKKKCMIQPLNYIINNLKNIMMNMRN